MPRTYVQTVNAAQMFRIVPLLDSVAGTMTLTAGYTIGALDPDGHFGAIPGAAVADEASVVVPLSTTLLDANTQLVAAIAQQEGLDLSLGDHVLPPSAA